MNVKTTKDNMTKQYWAIRPWLELHNSVSQVQMVPGILELKIK